MIEEIKKFIGIWKKNKWTGWVILLGIVIVFLALSWVKPWLETKAKKHAASVNRMREEKEGHKQLEEFIRIYSERDLKFFERLINEQITLMLKEKRVALIPSVESKDQRPQNGTKVEVRFSRVVDGDTFRIFFFGDEQDQSLRLLAIDTEESSGGSSKPVTPWGKEAKKRAEDFFQGAETVTIEFPGNEDLKTCLKKYRGAYGRLQVYAYRDGIDFQETMIHEGFSPYFVKYGNAVFDRHHQRYMKAEREAQLQRIGVWNQLAVNGSELRNYAALGTWWQLRASIIEDYRKVRAIDDTVLDTQLDYVALEAKARAGESAAVFTELRSIRRVGGRSGLIAIGTTQQPFNLFIPDIDSAEGQEIALLLETRYISSDEDHPRRSYAYVTGKLSTYQDSPQMILVAAEQITDYPVVYDDSE